MSATIQKAVSLLFWSHHWIFLASVGWHGWTRAASLPQLNPVDNFHSTKVQQSAGNVTKNVLKSPPWVTNSYSADENSVSKISSDRKFPVEELSNELLGPSRSVEDQLPTPTFPSTTSPSGRDIPPYMIDVFNQFSRLNGKRPKANIVRSFLDQEEQCKIEEDQIFNGSTDRDLEFERVLRFNVTLPKYETLDTAELRLFIVVASTSTEKGGAVAKISIFHDNGASLKKVIVRMIYRLDSGWESFFLTDFVQNRINSPPSFMERTFRNSASVTMRFRIRIEGAYFPFLGITSSHIKMDCSDRIEYKSLLAIYSDDTKSARGIFETNMANKKVLQTEEMANLINMRIFEIYSPKESLSTNDADAASYQVDLDSNTSDHDAMADLAELPNKDDMVGIFKDSFGGNGWDSSTKADGEQLSNFVSLNDGSSFHSYRAKRAARNYCRRIPMEVDFSKIGWDTWVKFPTKYQAYKCVGKCFYPITSNWSPSNHAIVQSLMHMYDRSVSRPCCVPVEFGSMSMMYLNENDILTFKYDYREMIVRSCGCQ